MGRNHNNHSIGLQYEEEAILYLQEMGYRVLQKNFYCRQGEIDIIAREQGYLVFIEVKYRKNAIQGRPEEAVGSAKRHKIIKSSMYYMYRHGISEDTPCRFDVVSICGQEINLIRNAFELDG